MKKLFSEIMPMNLPFILAVILFLTVIGYELKVKTLKLELATAKTTIQMQASAVDLWQATGLTAVAKQETKTAEAMLQARPVIANAKAQIAQITRIYKLDPPSDKSAAYEEIELLVNSSFNL